MSTLKLDAEQVDYRSLFEALPGLYLVLQPNAPNFTIMAASNSYLRATMTERDNVIGRGLFEVFPDNPDDPRTAAVDSLRGSLMRVLATRRPHAMAIQKYDIRRPESEGGGFETRYWSPLNSPVLDDNESLVLIAHRVEDVTSLKEVEAQNFVDQQHAAEERAAADEHLSASLLRMEGLQDANQRLLRIISERQSAAEVLQRSEERLRAAVTAVGDIMWTSDAQGGMRGEQACWDYFFGDMDPAKRNWLDSVHPEDSGRTVAAWRDAVARRQIFTDTHRLRRFDGCWRHFVVTAAPVFEPDGAVREWVGVHTDVTDRIESEAEIHDLNRRLKRAITETHHRVKNNLQVVAALIDMHTPPDGAPVSGDVLARLSVNVRSLGVIHELLMQASRVDASTGDITVPATEMLHKMLAQVAVSLAHRPLQTEIADVELSGKQATSLAIILNELIANAVKHGQGEIHVSLDNADGRITASVRDRGPGFPPGFSSKSHAKTGLDLIEHLARLDLGAALEFGNCDPHGAVARLVFTTGDSGSRAIADLRGSDDGRSHE